jgi:hypothetical protein
MISPLDLVGALSLLPEKRVVDFLVDSQLQEQE